MRKSEVPVQRLAAGLLVQGGPTREVGRMMAVAQAVRMLEWIPDEVEIDADVASTALHETMCLGTAWGRSHTWQYHRSTSADLLEFIDDPDLIHRIIDGAVDPNEDWAWWYLT